jgi:hypothetical protein
MVIDDLHATGVSILPNETQTVAVVNPDAVLPSAVVSQGLQEISWSAEVVETSRRMKLEQFANRCLLDGLQLPGPDAVEDLLRVGVTERADHVLIVYR